MVFGNVLQPDANPDFKGPDGMAFGTDGRLYCTVYNQKNVTVLDQRGEVVERLILTGRSRRIVPLCLYCRWQEAARH